MERNRILLTAFRNTSAEYLLEGITHYDTLFLPNDKIKDSQKLIKALSDGEYDLVISIGQRPNIKNKVHIETTARIGEEAIETVFGCERLAAKFAEKGICAKLSHNAGTSYCNALYGSGLRYIRDNGLDTQMVFIHVPYRKNIVDFPDFQRKFLDAIFEIEKEPV